MFSRYEIDEHNRIEDTKKSDVMSGADNHRALATRCGNDTDDAAHTASTSGKKQRGGEKSTPLAGSNFSLPPKGGYLYGVRQETLEAYLKAERKKIWEEAANILESSMLPGSVFGMRENIIDYYREKAKETP